MQLLEKRRGEEDRPTINYTGSVAKKRKEKRGRKGKREREKREREFHSRGKGGGEYWWRLIFRHDPREMMSGQKGIG